MAWWNQGYRAGWWGWSGANRVCVHCLPEVHTYEHMYLCTYVCMVWWCTNSFCVHVCGQGRSGT
jgi:hypothetical protein